MTQYGDVEFVHNLLNCSDIELSIRHQAII